MKWFTANGERGGRRQVAGIIDAQTRRARDRRRAEDDRIRAVFTRALAEADGDVALAYRITESELRKRRADRIDDADLDALIAAAAREEGTTPVEVMSESVAPAACRARDEVWWKLRQRTPAVALETIGDAFRRNKPAVLKGVRRFEARLAESAELRARVAWEPQAQKVEAA